MSWPQGSQNEIKLPESGQQIAGLLKLAGKKEADASLSNASRNLLVLRLISEALSKGATWSQIGTAILGRPNAKLAKRAAKNLAKLTQRDLIRNPDVRL